MKQDERKLASPLFLCALAAVVMAYGWGYRGIVGHEGGAMVPGAMLGLALCLGTGRLDWHRRAAVAGLFGAVGWAWGGSFSYMEQTMYTVTDSFVDVLYGYSVLFLLGGLWAGIGGAVLGLAFTLPRSHLQRFVGPFVAISAVLLAVYLYFFFNQGPRGFIDRYTAQHFHDADAFPATIVLVVSLLYALVRPRERAEALLFLFCAAAWWVGYLGFTKLGGLSLAPPFRNEGWGGVIGILVVLLVFLWRQNNRAAFMLSLYGLVGGGIAFPLAVFVRHPIRVSWGPFAEWGPRLHWKTAEESFGLFMGIAIALGVLRFARGRLAPPVEDDVPKRLDVFAAFVMLIGLMWINLRRAPMRWMERPHLLPDTPTLGLVPWEWFTLGGLVLTAVALYALFLYWKDRLVVAPPGPYGKGAVILLLLLWVTVGVGFAQMLPEARGEEFPLVDVSFVGFSSIATVMLLSGHRLASQARIPDDGTAPPSDPRWNVGFGHALVWVCVPFFLLAITGLSMAMQDGPVSGARLRFGPHAYWREVSQVMDTWRVAGRAPAIDGDVTAAENPPFRTLEFRRNRSVTLVQPDAREVSDAHTWQHADGQIWLDWHGRDENHPEHARVMLTIKDGRLYVPWPPHDTRQFYFVFDRISD